MGQPLDLWSLLRQTKGPQWWERQAYCTHNQQRYAVRVIACKLPPEKVGLARKRIEKRAQKKGRLVSFNSLVLAGWLLLITTLDELDWPATDVLRLYRVRWQIELFFRWLKCILGCRHLLSTSQNGVTIQVYLALIASLLISLWVGHKPTKLTYETLCFYFLGVVELDELTDHIATLKRHQ